MAKYTVQSPIKSGGKIYKVGSTITLEDATATPLLAKGRIKAPGGATNSGGGSAGDDAQHESRSDASAGKPKDGGKK